VPSDEKEVRSHAGMYEYILFYWIVLLHGDESGERAGVLALRDLLGCWRLGLVFGGMSPHRKN
jgi:hypothetical protein